MEYSIEEQVVDIAHKAAKLGIQVERLSLGRADWERLKLEKGVLLRMTTDGAIVIMATIGPVHVYKNKRQ